MRGYALILVALLALTGTTVGAAFIDLGRFNTPVALGIAATKASLVAVYFMHLRHASRISRMFAVAGVVWLGQLFVFTLADYFTRAWLSFTP